MLNEFVASQRARRSFALGAAAAESRKLDQLHKARAALELLHLPLSR